MKKLVKIKLINWHLYNDTEIDVNNNTCICGENGSGKSTLIDALHFVLSGGTCKFNTAANERNDRNVESYVRGKLGYENKEYLRNDDVITHVALEFFDDESNTYSVVGTVIYYSRGSKLEKHFYAIDNATIVSSCYVSKSSSPVLISELESNYKSLNKELSEFKGTVEQVKYSILSFLGLDKKDAEKYLDLLPKALAFKPIANINNFVFDYLLPERSLSLDNMKENVRNYSNLENLIERENLRLSSLTPLVDLANSFTIDNNKKTILTNLLNEFSLDTYLKRRDALEKDNSSLDLNIKELENTFNSLNEKKEELIKEINNLDNNELSNELKELNLKKVRLNNDLNKYNDLKNIVSGNIETVHNILSLDNIKINNSIKNYFYKEDYVKYKQEISNIKNKIEEKFELNLESLHEYKTSFDNHKINYDSKLRYRDSLEKGKKTYGENITNLIDILKKHFRDLYNIEIDINIFADLVDNVEPKWRNALEGFLNTRRFYLFIDKKYYDEALRVYENVAKENKIKVYGVGLVNVSKLEEVNDDNINENSLFTKMEYLTDDARNYAFMVLNNVRCVETVDELKNFDVAITPSGMLYSSFVANFINPRIYETPYLGRKSIALQIDKVSAEIEELYSILKEEENSIITLSKIKDNLSRVNKLINHIDLSENIFTLINNLSLDLNKVNDDIEKLTTGNLLEIQETVELKRKEKEEVTSKINETNNLITSLKGKKFSNENSLSLLNAKIEDLRRFTCSQTLKKEYENIKILYANKSSSEIENELNELRFNVEKKEKELISLMTRYVSNEDNKCDFKADVANINKFINLYNEIRDRNLVIFKDKARKAKEECELAFKNDFLYKIRTSINETYENINNLNKILKREENRFGKDKEIYEFVIMGSHNIEMKQYFDIFTSSQDYNDEGLFSEAMSEKNIELMESLFKKITSLDDKENEKELAKFIDYRNYMDYDIKITDKNNNVSYYSKGGKGKSGGETQTPFYVFIAASFNSICNKNKYQRKGSPLCLMFLDEAFNNMDENRIETMMNFYSKLDIQVLISVPTQRVSSIYKSVETILGIAKANDNALIYSLEKNGLEG